MSSTLHATTYKHAWSMLWICMNLRKFWIDKLLSKAEYQVLCYHAGRAFNFAAQYYSQLEKMTESDWMNTSSKTRRRLFIFSNTHNTDCIG